MKQISFLISMLLTVVIVVFAIANRHEIVLDFWPFEVQAGAPTYVVVLISLLVGILLGGAVMWTSDGRVRARARKEARRADELQREMARLRQERDRAIARAAPSAVVAQKSAGMQPVAASE